jgi:hypothetical protein
MSVTPIMNSTMKRHSGVHFKEVGIDQNVVCIYLFYMVFHLKKSRACEKMIITQLKIINFN